MATANNDIKDTEATLEIIIPTGEEVAVKEDVSEKEDIASPDAQSEEKGNAVEGAKEGTTTEVADIEALMEARANESEDQTPSSFSLKRTIGGAMIAKFVQSQMLLLFLIFAFLIIYITSRYWCQQEMVEIDKLEKELVQAQYKRTVCSSQLTEKSRESNIIKQLEAKGDSTLTIATEPPYLIKINK